MHENKKEKHELIVSLLSSSTHLQYLAAARIQVNGDPTPVNPGLIQRFKIINRAIPEATSSNLFESPWCQTRPPVSVLSEAVPGRLTAVCCRVCVRIRVFFFPPSGCE